MTQANLAFTDPASNPKALVAVTDVSQAGAIVYWRLSGVIPYERLQTAWDAAGLASDLLLPPTSPGAALREAMIKHQKRRTLARPVVRRNWELVAEEVVKTGEGDMTLAHTRTARARLVDQPPPVEGGPRPEPVLVIEGAPPEQTNSIRAVYDAARVGLNASEIGSWMIELIHRCHGVRLRDTGGFYFLPRGPHLDRWRAYADVIRSVSAHVLYQIPAMTAADTLAAIFDSVTAEAQQAIDEIRGDLLKAIPAGEAAPTVGKRALKARSERCEETLAVVATYEALLGTGLEELRAQIGALQAQITAAVLTLTAEE